MEFVSQFQILVITVEFDVTVLCSQFSLMLVANPDCKWTVIIGQRELNCMSNCGICYSLWSVFNFLKRNFWKCRIKFWKKNEPENNPSNLFRMIQINFWLLL